MAAKVANLLESLALWTLLSIAIFGVVVNASAFLLTVAQLGATVLGLWP